MRLMAIPAITKPRAHRRRPIFDFESLRCWGIVHGLVQALESRHPVLLESTASCRLFDAGCSGLVCLRVDPIEN